jgi:hypothetical protein
MTVFKLNKIFPLMERYDKSGTAREISFVDVVLSVRF